MELEISEKAAQKIADLLREPGKGAEASSGELDEAVVRSTLSGYVQLQGFGDALEGFPSQLKFRVAAVRTGGRVRVIIDIT